MDITITNGILTATINPKGAELNSLKNSTGTEYIWEGKPEIWGKHSPVLFPIVGTLKNNSYLYNGQVYAMTRHGFARDNVFSVLSQTEDSVVFSLSSNDDTKRVYPFDFELQLTYSFNNDALVLHYTVMNKDGKAMPFSIGAHPALALPGNFNDYSLVFEKEEALVSTQLENDLISNKDVPLPAEKNVLPLSYNLFDNDALIFKALQSKSVTIARSGQPYIQVGFADFPHLGIWTKKDAPFLCIEPWQGYSDSPNTRGNIIEKEGIVSLNPSEIYNAQFNVRIL